MTHIYTPWFFGSQAMAPEEGPVGREVLPAGCTACREIKGVCFGGEEASRVWSHRLPPSSWTL